MTEGFEVIELGGVRYCEIIRRETAIGESCFFSPPAQELQFGVFKRSAGFIEEPHYHPKFVRECAGIMQLLVVQKGKLEISFFTTEGRPFAAVTLEPGDAALLIDGAHSVRVLEDARCVTIKQGPYRGAEKDKAGLEVKE